jgi:hypothetical protein
MCRLFSLAASRPRKKHKIGSSANRTHGSKLMRMANMPKRLCHVRGFYLSIGGGSLCPHPIGCCGICPKPATAFVRASWGLCHARGASARSEAGPSRGAVRGSIGVSQSYTAPGPQAGAWPKDHYGHHIRSKRSARRDERLDMGHKYLKLRIDQSGVDAMAHVPSRIVSRTAAAI